ncbi:hypothetical protein Q7C36_013182 [Tachysurus vachellii]|uniref:Uncharacterized protein n=1 Tax=Tachysurus vachellii TaxID=175792 RepID=A0AA88SP77_TACVA|nr:hypothetical protein Q7C36_013182 [Tachysurus vachellii]
MSTSKEHLGYIVSCLHFLSSVFTLTAQLAPSDHAGDYGKARWSRQRGGRNGSSCYHSEEPQAIRQTSHSTETEQRHGQGLR